MEFIKSEDIENNILKSELFQLKGGKQSKISIDHLINIFSPNLQRKFI